jgi:hypothetical protein
VSVKVIRIKATSHLVTLNHSAADLGILKRQQTLVRRAAPQPEHQPLLVWPISLEVAIKDVVGDDRPFAVVLWLSTASGPRPQGIDPHQSFDPAKPAGQPLVRYKRSPGPFALRSKSRTSRQTRRAP